MNLAIISSQMHQVAAQPKLREPNAPPKVEKKSDGATSKSSSRDSVEIDFERLNRLKDIKQKIQTGYYSSRAVADDISEKLGNILDSVT